MECCTGRAPMQVEWDSGTTKGVEKANDCERVSPWELETDPDENLRREEDKKKAAEASKRAARAARGARRAWGPYQQPMQLLACQPQSLSTHCWRPWLCAQAVLLM